MREITPLRDAPNAPLAYVRSYAALTAFAAISSPP
jgi:hypothetical protein